MKSVAFFYISGLKFNFGSIRKFLGLHTRPNPPAARLAIVLNLLAGYVQKRGIENNNFVKWKETFRSYRL